MHVDVIMFELVTLYGRIRDEWGYAVVTDLDVPLENVVAMYEAAKKYERNPINC